MFSWDQDLTAVFPEECKEFEDHMHGGFNEDQETGVIYTGIPGAGLYSVSPDLQTWTRLGTDDRLKKNIHGLVVFKHKSETLIAAALNQEQLVLILTLHGEVKQVLETPTGNEFDFAEANQYYTDHRAIKMVPHDYDSLPEKVVKKHNIQAGVFSCTDVTYLDGKLYVVTGYCPGDFVLTAEERDGKWSWGHLAWGGKGDGLGKFRTAHGVFAFEDNIYVANREAHQVVKFEKDGTAVKVLPGIPPNSRICNVSYAEEHGYFLINPLAPVTEGQKSAPIYAYMDDAIISTIIPGDLGVPVLKHVHHVWPHYVKGQLYLMVHGWNKGKFAILKHEPGFSQQAKAML